MSATARLRLLLVGPLPIEGDVVGGTKVSFAALVATLQRDERLAVTVHDTSRPRQGRGRIARVFQDLGGMARLSGRLVDPRRRYDVAMFNTSSGGLLQSGPLVWLACRMRGARLVVRVFGGDLDVFFTRLGPLRRWLVRRSIFRAERLLLQTHALETHFASEARTSWFPTTRDMPAVPARVPTCEAEGARRFLFLAQLRREKGVAEAVAAAASLPEGATLTVAGPAMPGFALTTLAPSERWSYVGPIAPADVPALLVAHDVLVFPTYHEGEGLPGIVIEALQLGLPVVATRFRALEELLTHDTDGLLVPPREVPPLAEAMTRLAQDTALYRRLAEGARRTGERYRSAPRIAELTQWLIGDDAMNSACELEPRSDTMSVPSRLPTRSSVER